MFYTNNEIIQHLKFFSKGRCLVVCSWLLGMFFLQSACAQNLTLRTLANLPGKLSETSGLEVTSNDTLWSHNDSGGDPVLYAIDTNGTILDSTRLSNGLNRDWEELAQDPSGNVYIGDFGNNGNGRRDLVIYKLAADSLGEGLSAAGTIRFNYPDQPAFPPVPARLHYDMEAMVAFDDSLYLFSKNRTDPYDGYTRLYRLPTDTGTYQAELIDSFNTGPGPKEFAWVTAADIRPDGKQLALLSSNKVYLFSCYPGRQFFKGAFKTLSITFSQKEALCWADTGRIFVTDEALNMFLPQTLYTADMGAYNWLPEAVLPGDTAVVGALQLDVTNAGRVGASYAWSTGETTPSIMASSPGVYWVVVTAPNGCMARDTVEVSFLVNAIGPALSDLQVEVMGHPGVGGKRPAIKYWLPKAGRVELGWTNVATGAYRVVLAERQKLGQYFLPDGAAYWPAGSGVYLFSVRWKGYVLYRRVVLGE